MVGGNIAAIIYSTSMAPFIGASYSTFYTISVLKIAFYFPPLLIVSRVLVSIYLGSVLVSDIIISIAKLL